MSDEYDFKVVADLAEELGHGDLASLVRALDPWRAKHEEAIRDEELRNRREALDPPSGMETLRRDQLLTDSEVRALYGDTVI